MKSPLCGYYGGKGRMASDIADMIDRQDWLGYIEPFCGGASVFFAIQKGNPQRGYTLNDLDSKIINFYTVAKTRCDELVALIDKRQIASSEWHQLSREVWRADIKDEVEHAWATWYSIITSFSCILGAPFSRIPDNMSRQPRRLRVGKDRVNHAVKMLEMVTLENIDAIELIKKYDRPGNIYYIDPPYVGANQSHYEGYSQKDFDNLLKTLGELRGKFILSHYQNDALDACINKYGWHVKQVKTNAAVHTTVSSPRVELLVYNFVDGVNLL